ncbi:MAG: hypothetical protein SPI21_03050 [Hungatella hathewayi]|uniref:hypothetical protein n=1 Tax=Hungatella TaxID=1649459 RepID=UPI001107328B|nr:MULTISPECIES: hypothetical protein [Hungatella]MCI7380765.1 hypothetical protein [Hungatella sp.]MDY6235759.1 hypothetical protein [Hungatella hathewayi]
MLGEKRGQSLFRPPEEFKETEQEMGTSETGEESAKTEIRPEETELGQKETYFEWVEGESEPSEEELKKTKLWK